MCFEATVDLLERVGWPQKVKDGASHSTRGTEFECRLCHFSIFITRLMYWDFADKQVFMV